MTDEANTRIDRANDSIKTMKTQVKAKEAENADVASLPRNIHKLYSRLSQKHLLGRARGRRVAPHGPRGGLARPQGVMFSEN